MTEPAPHNRLAILFADIVGSTRLYEKFGDARAHAAVDGCISALKQVTDSFSGRTVKTIGDELMAVFPNPEMAWFAAAEMHWRVAELPVLDDTRISIRIGFHYGDAVEREGDVFGDSVNVAARMSELAKGEQILTTGQVQKAISPEIAAGARRLWSTQVKGRAEPVEVFEVLWDANDDATVSLSAQFIMPKGPRRLRLLHGGKEVRLDHGGPMISIGRDAVNELVVDDPKASRVHARIEWRRDKFVLTDVSTNGTYVRSENAVETCLRREEHILERSGTMALGHSHARGPRSFIEFYVEYFSLNELGGSAAAPARLGV